MINVIKYIKSIKTTNGTNLSVFLYLVLLIKILTVESAIFKYADVIQYEKYIETQKCVLETIHSYLPSLTNNKKNIIKRYMRRYERENALAKNNISRYLAHPFNCYVLVKGVSKDLGYVEDILTRYTDYVRPKNLSYPTNEDYESTTTLIVLLVYVYNLNVTELADGNLTADFSENSKKFSAFITPLTSGDCYELALATYEHDEYDTSLAWMRQALRKYRTDCDKDCPFIELDLVQFMRRTYYVKDRLHSFNNLYSNEKRQIGEKVAGVNDKNGVSIQSKDGQDNMNADQKIGKYDLKEIYAKWSPTKRKLCWREHINRSSLNCQYRYGPHPFLRLARFKTEMLHLEPNIAMFHNVISDKEFYSLKKLSEKVVEKVDITDFLSTGTLRQAAFFTKNISNVTKNLAQRALDISGLIETKTDTFKMLQYGPVGYFSPHVDCVTDMNDKTANDDHRCIPARSTVLFYLSEEHQGGATAFLRLNMSVFSKKGAALMFKTELPYGKVDDDTVHGSCPVFYGTKWVLTQWL